MTEHPALAAERARAAAVCARDLAALESLVADRLVYTHATGTRHDRAAWLAYVAGGPRFEHVVFTVDEVVALGDDAALLIGRLALRFRREGQPPQEAQSWASALWQRVDGAWRLRAFQSTRDAPA